MKTFKLVSLELIEQAGEMEVTNLPLLDGLIIDREDDKDQWVLECLLDQKYFSYFTELREKNNNIMMQAKITKEANHPATFVTSIISINEMEDHINVLFIGKLINNQSLLEEDFQ